MDALYICVLNPTMECIPAPYPPGPDNAPDQDKPSLYNPPTQLIRKKNIIH